MVGAAVNNVYGINVVVGVGDDAAVAAANEAADITVA